MKSALIVGAGPGISSSFARALAQDGYHVTLAARDTDKLTDLTHEIDGRTIACNVLEANEITQLFQEIDATGRDLEVVLYNPSFRERGSFLDLDPERTRKSLMVTAYGGFLVAQEAAQRMITRRRGAIFFTGASASVKGYAKSAPFAMGKFALRGLAQSMARELGPQGIHLSLIHI